MVKLTIRIPDDTPDDLHAALTEAAAEDQRSLNGEILWLLRQALDTRNTG